MSVRTIETMLDWVEDNIEDVPTLDKMANYVGYSEFYCSVKFHECVGVSFKEYVLKRKLKELENYATDKEKAEERIKETEQKLKWLEEIKAKVESILEV